ncbi:hypothetical protein GCM10010256_50170 [Streptomyces coeruleorubidus]|nr:hypothetical protein GCM10010256_50170 [Streptomyces coeruleorubidus]
MSILLLRGPVCPGPALHKVRGIPTARVQPPAQPAPLIPWSRACHRSVPTVDDGDADKGHD